MSERQDVAGRRDLDHGRFGLARAALNRPAKALGVHLETVDARNPGEIDTALDTIKGMRADALLVGEDVLFAQSMPKIAQLAREVRLPAMFPWSNSREHGRLDVA